MPNSGSSAPYSGELLQWYRLHRRDLPWRRSSDPYAIWVSEVMLQQTQVATVIPYFERWMTSFPTVESLAAADEQTVLEHWAGLGYYRRCRLLHAGARHVVATGTPKTLAEWREVPGVGRYTAAAIASIAQGIPASLVDGNVERVCARLTGDAHTGKDLLNATWKWSDEVLYHPDPGTWNQALMELGATICKPAHPTCPECPIRSWCYAFQTGKQDQLPTATPKLMPILQFHTCWVLFCQGKFAVRQIPRGEWWEGMWEFPRVVHLKEESPQMPIAGVPDVWPEDLGDIRHSVTNHRIRLRTQLLRLDEPVESLRWVTRDELIKIALPSPQRKAMRLAFRQLGLD